MLQEEGGCCPSALTALWRMMMDQSGIWHRSNNLNIFATTVLGVTLGCLVTVAAVKIKEEKTLQ